MECLVMAELKQIRILSLIYLIIESLLNLCLCNTKKFVKPE
jgi:hypothetical protein